MTVVDGVPFFVCLKIILEEDDSSSSFMRDNVSDENQVLLLVEIIFRFKFRFFFNKNRFYKTKNLT